MEFVKVHGAGNDFVLLPDLDDRLNLDSAFVRRLCAAHHGLGADGVIRLGAARGDGDDVFMDYRNADGSIAEMCGNGVRCVAKYVLDRGVVAGDRVRVDTRAGTRVVDVVERHADGRVATVAVDMGEPGVGKVDWSAPLPLRDARDSAVDGPAAHAIVDLRLTTVDMGNPHAVYVTADVDRTPLARAAALVNRLPDFPDGVNVEAIEVVNCAHLRGRVHERGVGETLASGTGVSAMAVAAMVLELVDRRVTVAVPGGELGVDWSEPALRVSGPAVEVAHGTLDDTWLNNP